MFRLRYEADVGEAFGDEYPAWVNSFSQLAIKLFKGLDAPEVKGHVRADYSLKSGTMTFWHRDKRLGQAAVDLSSEFPPQDSFWTIAPAMRRKLVFAKTIGEETLSRTSAKGVSIDELIGRI
ncbi:MAG: hypothetical protein EOR99_25745 [Mesorhizobium sp.]|nr:MAG: hypothetical protein EOR99_25745 [Mesorhizobium sp.]